MSVIITRGGARGGFQEALHEPLCGAGIPSALDQKVENEAILVDCAPRPVVSPAIETTTSSMCHLSPRAGARWRI